MKPEGGEPVHATVNGEQVELAPGTTLADVAAAHGALGRGVAMALDREVVPRSRWELVEVREGAHVEVVAGSAGG